MSKITLILEKNGKQQSYEFTSDLKGLLKAAKRIRQLMKENWELIDCSGDNPQIVGYIKRQIEVYNQKPEAYKIPIRETLAVTKDITGVSAKELAATAKKVVKHKLLHPVRRKKRNG